MDYNYQLQQTVSRDLIPIQQKIIEEDGFVYNEKLKTWDKYDIKYEEKVIVEVQYKTEIFDDVPLNEYSIKEVDNNVYNVKYYTSSDYNSFFWFFKRMFKRKQMEIWVDDRRYQQLLDMLSLWEIFELEKIITPTVVSRRVQLTEKEFLEYYNQGENIDIIKKWAWVKKEGVTIYGEMTIEEKDYEEKMKGKTMIDRKDHTERYMVDKQLSNQRALSEYNYQYYLPWVWSRASNHVRWTLANFVCKVSIKYITGFDPLDPKFINLEDIKKDIIDIIKSEHKNSQYIQERSDLKDGFSFERSHHD